MRRLRVGIDDLTITGLISLVAWMALANLWVVRGSPGHLLWLSDVAMLLTAVGLLTRSPLLLSAQFVGIFAFHLLWQIDLAAQLVLDWAPFGFASFVVDAGPSRVEKAISLFQHLWLIPVTAWGVIRLKAVGRAWVLQTAQTAVVLTLTALLVDPAGGVNVVATRVFGGGTPLSRPAYFGLLAVGAPVLLYRPTNALARWLSDTGPAARARALGGSVASALALAAAVSLAVSAITLTSTPAFPAGAPNELRGMSVRELEALPVDPSRVSLTFIGWGSDGDSLLQLQPHVGPLPSAPLLAQAAGLLDLKRLLDEHPVDRIPGTPHVVVARGILGADIVRAAAVVASDRLYLQEGVVEARGGGGFGIPIYLGRAGLEEFGLDPSRLDRLPAPDPYIVGGGIGALYAVAIVGIGHAGPIARTPFFLFKRTGLAAPGDLDSVRARLDGPT